MKLLTLHVRKERFSGGQLANTLEQGLLVAILERLRNVSEQTAYPVRAAVTTPSWKGTR
jgi:hypothetical protein